MERSTAPTIAVIVARPTSRSIACIAAFRGGLTD